MPDGTIITGVPDNITQTDLLARYSKYTPAQTAPESEGILGGLMKNAAKVETLKDTIFGQVKSPASVKPTSPFEQPAVDAMGNPTGMAEQPAERPVEQPQGIAALSAPKPPSELAPGEEFTKGLGAGVVGLKSMWENAGVMKDVGVLDTVEKRLGLFGQIDKGDITDFEQLHGLDPNTSQARSYLGATPEMREKMKNRLTGEVAKRTDFVKASVDTLAQYQKEMQQYKGRTVDLTDVEGMKDFANWLSYNVGSGAVQMAPIMIAAATTGPGGVALLGTGMGVSEAVGNRMEALAPKLEGLTPNQKADAVADYVNKTGDTSLAVGIVSGAFDSLLGPAATLAKRGLSQVIKGETRKEALKQGIKELPKQMGEEFITGGAQEATQIAGAVREGETPEFFNKENVKKIINSAAAEAAGAVGGGGASTAARVYGANNAENAKEDLLKQAFEVPANEGRTPYVKPEAADLETLARSKGFLQNQPKTASALAEELTSAPKPTKVPKSESQDLEAMLAELEAQLEGKPAKAEPAAEVPGPVKEEPSITELKSEEPVVETPKPLPSLPTAEQFEEFKASGLAGEQPTIRAVETEAPAAAPQPKKDFYSQVDATLAQIDSSDKLVDELARMRDRQSPLTVNRAADPIASREGMLWRLASTNPEKAATLAQGIQDNVAQYSESSGFPPDTLKSFASQIVKRLPKTEPVAAPTVAPKSTNLQVAEKDIKGKHDVINSAEDFSSAEDGWFEPATNKLHMKYIDGTTVKHYAGDKTATGVVNLTPITNADEAKAAVAAGKQFVTVGNDSAAIKEAAPARAPVAKGKTAAKPADKASPLRKAAYAKNPFMTFLADKGLRHEKGVPGSLMSEFNGGKQKMVSGHGPIFKKTGLQIDELLPLAIQDGYLPPDATEEQLYSLIQKAFGNNKVEPVYSEQGQEDLAKKYEERMAEEEPAYEERAAQSDAEWLGMSEEEYVNMMAREVAAVSDADFADIDQAINDLSEAPASNISVRAAMEALGFTEQEIQDEENRTAPKADEAVAGETTQGDEAGQAAPNLELETQTAEELKAKQAEIDRLNKENERLSKQAEAKAKADAERDEFVLTGSDRAADVAAAQGQQDIFGAIEEAPAEANEEGVKVVPFEADAAVVGDLLNETKPEDTPFDERYNALMHPVGNVAKPKATEFLTPQEAEQTLSEWKAEAKRQGVTNKNSDRTILSLFDASGEWSKPWRDAGYNVLTFDIQTGEDINDFSAEFLMDEGLADANIWGILAAPPCTDFASSGAQYWAKKDAKGQTEISNELVRQVLRSVEFLQPKIWALENPVGRIAKLNNLPPAHLTFDPNMYGDPYTKKTLLWGNFDNNLPTAPVEATEGSRIIKLGSKDKYARSLTPEGFAYAFFMANNAESMTPAERLARTYYGVDPKAFDGATEANEKAIKDSAFEDDYYDGNLEDAAKIAREVIGKQPERQTVTAPDGAVLRYPVALDMVNNGYQVLALNNPRTYVDKGGDPHRTFEKGPLRISMTPQRTLFQNRNSVNVGFGNEDEMTLEALLVDPNKRNQGLATQAMQDIVDAADKNGVTLYMEPTLIVNLKNKDVGPDRDQLINFYNKFGFEFSPYSDKVMQRAPKEVASEVVGPAEKPAAPQLTREPITIEGEFTEIGEEQQRALITDQTSKLSDAQVSTLEKFYGFARDTEDFANAARQDVVNFITKGATYVNGKIRAIIRSMANGVLSVAVAFNPQFISQPVNVVVPAYETRTEQVTQPAPADAERDMSPQARRAYEVLYPALKDELIKENKLFLITDKPTAMQFIFNPDGTLLMKNKVLLAKGIGDFEKGDNNIDANKITPAGVRTLVKRFNTTSTEGYDFNTVFGTMGVDEKTGGTYFSTVYHSVYTHLPDAQKRLQALKEAGPENSRYSFGCINVDKATFETLVKKHSSQMDGATLFVVPDNDQNVMNFINGEATNAKDIVRRKVEPVTKETKVEVERAAETAAAERNVVGKEEEGPMFYNIEPRTQTASFKKWFGDSKVVDENGQPLVVYHGTLVRSMGNDADMGDITAFDRMFSTRVRRPSIDTVGSWFSTNPGEGGAEMYSGNIPGSVIYPVYLSIKNPQVTTFQLMTSRARKLHNGKDDGRPIGAEEVEAYRTWLKSMGKDGIKIESSGNQGSTEFDNQVAWIALEPEQIKSAIGNRGTYDESGAILNDLSTKPVIEEEKKRSPSFKRQVAKLNRDYQNGKISSGQLVNEVDWALKQAEDARLSKEPAEKQRGYLELVKRLSEAAKRGDISLESFELATWFMRNNPALVEDLGVSIRGKGEEGVGGQYLKGSRVMRLIKEGSSNLTVTHEILHHLERMMPADVQQAIRKAWSKQLLSAQKKAKTPAEQLYFKLLFDAHYMGDNFDYIDVPSGEMSKVFMQAMAELDFNKPGSKSSMEMASTLLKMSLVPIQNYQYFNPSEFWAVNGSEIVQGRFEAVQGGVLARLKNWLKELGQIIKGFVGMNSNASIIKALNSLSKADGQFVTKDMLGEGEYKSIRRNYEGNEAPAASWESPEESKMDTFIYKLQDKLIDTKRVIESIKKTSGDIADNWNAYLKEELYHGRTAKRTQDFLNREMLPILEEMKDKGVTLGQFEEYLHMRHAEERNIQVAKVNPKMPGTSEETSGSGMSTKRATKYLSELTPEQNKTFESLASKFDKIIDNTQKLLVSSGLETQDTIDAWNQAYEHYIPLMRDDLDFKHHGTGLGAGYSTKGNSSKSAFGSTKKVIDIFANVALQRERAIVRSEKARIGRALYGLAIKNPNPGFWLPINPDAIKNKEKLTQELIDLGLSPVDAENIIQEPKVASIDKKTGLVKYQVNPLMRDSDNVFPVRINGEDRYIFFNTSDDRAIRMVEALKNLDAEKMGFFLGAMGTATRWLASVNTQFNPVFGAWNFVRDVQGAAFNLTTTEIAGQEKEVMSGVFPALRGIYSDLRKNRKKQVGEGEWAKLFEQYQMAGGQTGYRDQFNKAKEKASIVQRELNKLDRGNVSKAAHAVFNWLSDYNDAMENAVRLSAFKVALDKGLSEERAASIAKNLTVNFNRKGAGTPTLQALYAFFNAAVQGTARLAETLRGPAGKKIMAGGIAIGVFQALALAMAGYDDDEPPEFLKNKNLILPIPGGDYLIVPMPLGFNVFPGVGRLATEYVLGQAGMITGAKGAGDKLVSMGSLILDAFNPLGSGSVLQMVAPTIADPWVSILGTNRDAFGRPISKEDRATAPTPGYTRSRETASAFSKAFAEFLNYVSSPIGTKYTKGLISPTADQIDYLIGQYTGGVGREIMKAGQYGAAVVNGETGELPSYRVPIVGKMYGETESPAAVSAKFYDNVTKLAEHENEIKMRIKNKENVQEYRAEHPEVRFINRVNNLENQITAINKQKKALQEQKAPEERIKRLDERKTRMMKQLNDQIKNIEQQ
jgi:ribosomal protein S18 acetylase RimI-like enzyme